MQACCETIWGKGYYDIDVETDDYEKYMGFVKRDLGDNFGPPLTATGLCNSSEQALKELDRMLRALAKQEQTGQSAGRQHADTKLQTPG